MRILIARHGQDEDNAAVLLNGLRDKPLTKLGREQAELAGKKLLQEGPRVDVILCSPLKRARETAVIISKIIKGPKPIIEPLLIERDFGILTGKPLSDIPRYATKTLQTEVVNYFIEVEGAENFPALYRRASELLLKLESNYDNQNILLVTHGDIGKMIRAAYHKWTWEKGLKTPHFKNSEILYLDEYRDRIK
jgi:broad specificity phosphatase PhoE